MQFKICIELKKAFALDFNFTLHYLRMAFKNEMGFTTNKNVIR